MNQLLSITHEIDVSFDEGYEVRGVFLGISKAFDTVWHEGLIFKLEQNGISGKLLRLIKDFLSDRKQRSFKWTVLLLDGCPSRSSSRFYIGPLLLLIYINDLLDNLVYNPNMFADDTSIFSTVTDPNVTANQINNELHNISTWGYQWKMIFNPDTSKQAQEVILSRKVKVTAHLQLAFNNNPACLLKPRTRQNEPKPAERTQEK